MRKIYLWLILILLQYSLSVLASTPNSQDKELKNYIDRWRLENNIPGMAVTIDKLGDHRVTIVSGEKNIHPSSLVTSNTPFQIGSITKTFTAAAILKLEEQGKLSIYDKIGKWFPEYPRWKDITIQQLLNMSSGIYRYEQDHKFAQSIKANPERQWEAKQLINVSYQHPEYFNPGQGWRYSNANYILLGELIKKITHQSLNETYNKFFLKNSFNLKNTQYLDSIYNHEQMQMIAHGYHDDQNITSYNMSVFGAAGAMISTSKDIASWIHALFSGKVLQEKQVNEFQTTIPFDAPPKPEGSRFGLGVYLLHSNQYGDIWWYSGVTNGYISLFMYLPQQKIIITSMINRIKGEDYWILMPDHPFAKNIISRVLS